MAVVNRDDFQLIRQLLRVNFAIKATRKEWIDRLHVADNRDVFLIAAERLHLELQVAVSRNDLVQSLGQAPAGFSQGNGHAGAVDQLDPVVVLGLRDDLADIGLAQIQVL